jgi:hypothetical protein
LDIESLEVFRPKKANTQYSEILSFSVLQACRKRKLASASFIRRISKNASFTAFSSPEVESYIFILLIAEEGEGDLLYRQILSSLSPVLMCHT